MLVQLIAKGGTGLRSSRISSITTGAMGMPRRIRQISHHDACASGKPARRAMPALACLAFAVVVTMVVLVSGPTAVAGPISDDAELSAAMSCGYAKKTNNPCDVPACFSNYLARTQAADVSPDAKNLLSSAAAACPQPPPKEKDNRSDEEQMLKDARECMIKADPCYARACYAGYFQKYGDGGSFRAIVRTDLNRARQACPMYADGMYNAKSVEGCSGRSQFGIHIVIKDGTISWKRDFQGSNDDWTGAIEPDGRIHASVGGSKGRVADGKFNDEGREIQMHYPECTTPVPISILGRIN
jgi:hypothetical protein